MSDEIEQLEFRWTTARQGFFATAASPGAMKWEQYLQPVARPPEISLPQTVVYQTFGKSAVIIFRHILRSAGGSVPEQEREAARALIGPAELLTPDIALGCAALSSPGFLRPGIGRTPGGGELPVLAFGAIRDEAASQDLVAELDQAARNWAGQGELARVLLAATLAQPDMAVAVHLNFQRTLGRDTAALLWGLWQLAHPILQSGRDWSFSTGEKPLGTRAQTRLPHLIVRDLSVEGGPPDALRPEIALSQEEKYAPDRYPTQPLADKLVDAYVKLSVPGPPSELASLGPDGTIKDRLDEIRHSLGLTADVASPDGPVLSAPANPFQLADMFQQPGPAQPAPNGWVPQGYPAEDWARSGEDPARRQAVPGGQHSADAAPATVPSETFDSLLDELARSNPGAVRSLERLATGPQRPGPRQRLALLRLAAKQGWYVRQLDGLRPSGAEAGVGHLLVLLAEPDLADPEHYQEACQELAGLMNRPETPGVALLALERIARKRVDPGLWDLVAVAAGRRWLADLGRSRPVEKPGEPEPSQRASRRSPWRWLFRRRGRRGRPAPSPVRMARIWLGLFLAVTLVLCLMLVFR
jgi:hypothetical protein